MKEKFEADEEQIKNGLDLFERIINRKLIKPYYAGFKSITQEEIIHEKSFGKKNSLNNFFHFMFNKIKENKEWAVRTLLKNFGLTSMT